MHKLKIPIDPQFNFQYQEDIQFFADQLSEGDREFLIRKYGDYFDFRAPLIKRKEFNKIRKQVFNTLVSKYGLVCQLKAHPDCSKIKKFDVDHYIPLSSNELNKSLRHIKRVGNKKVVSQSFGSNNIKNLQIVCGRCNAFKKHRMQGFL